MVYADDMALILGTLSKAQQLSTSLEIASFPCKRIKYMCINVDKNCPLVTTLDNNALENVNDFKYLGSFIGESMKDFLRRQRQSWGMLVTN